MPPKKNDAPGTRVPLMLKPNDKAFKPLLMSAHTNPPAARPDGGESTGLNADATGLMSLPGEPKPYYSPAAAGTVHGVQPDGSKVLLRLPTRVQNAPSGSGSPESNTSAQGAQHDLSFVPPPPLHTAPRRPSEGQRAAALNEERTEPATPYQGGWKG